ncbi:MAG: SAM-dependent methyltransferase, partial [Fusobacteriaceae bacterium]
MNKFYGIGVGVGDSSMLTLKAIETLKKIDVVILPEAKTGEGSTAYTIASKYLNENVEK